jgi:hypothetical protein
MRTACVYTVAASSSQELLGEPANRGAPNHTGTGYSPPLEKVPFKKNRA